MNPALGFSSMYNVLASQYDSNCFLFCVLNSGMNLSVYLVTTAYGFSTVTSGAKILKDWHRMGGLDNWKCFSRNCWIAGALTF